MISFPKKRWNKTKKITISLDLVIFLWNQASRHILSNAQLN